MKYFIYFGNSEKNDIFPLIILSVVKVTISLLLDLFDVGRKTAAD